MTMYFFTFLAAPTPDAKEYLDAGGAYVNCWIQNSDRQQAHESAIELIQDYGWAIEALEEEAVVTSADYVVNDEDREYYEQALVEGEVLVFTTWPRGDEGEGDEDDDEEDEEDESGGDLEAG
jgi:hypothetical protein